MAIIKYADPSGLTDATFQEPAELFTITSHLYSVNIVGIQTENDARVTTATNHGLSVGQYVVFRNVGGASALNSTQNYETTGVYKRVIEIIDATTFRIDFNVTQTYTSGGTVVIEAISRNPSLQIYFPSHTFNAGDLIYFDNISGMTQLNTMLYYVGEKYENGFSLLSYPAKLNVNSTGWGPYTTSTAPRLRLLLGRVITNITNSNPCVVTVPNHTFSNNQYVYFNRMKGMMELENKVYKIDNVSGNTFELVNCDSTGYGIFDNSDSSVCARTMSRPAINYMRDIINEVRIIKTNSTITTGTNFTWEYGSFNVATSNDVRGVISVGHVIHRPNEGGNGHPNGAYRVMSITANNIVLSGAYTGTSGVDASIVSYIAQTDYQFSTSTVLVHGANNTMSGGWDFDTNTQNGQTWLRSPLGWLHGNAFGFGTGNIHNINFVEFHQNTLATNCTVSNCSFLYHGNMHIYVPIQMSTIVDSCFFDGHSGGNTTINFASGTYTEEIKITNSVFTCRNNSSQYGVFCNTMIAVLKGIDFSGTKFIHSRNGGVALQNCSSVYMKNAKFIDTIGTGLNIFSSYGRDCRVSNCEFENSFTNSEWGLVIQGAYSYSNKVENCKFKNMFRGIMVNTGTSGTIVENNEFENCAYGVFSNWGTGYVELLNNKHITPGINALYSHPYAGPFNVMGDTIDSASISKRTNLTTDIYSHQNMFNINAFGVQEKNIGTHLIAQDKNILTPDNFPTISISTGNNTLGYKKTIPVESIYVTENISQNITFILKAQSAWSGKITPILRLNGRVIVTGTEITTISTTDWDTHNIEALITDITEEGVLELCFIYESSAVSINTAITQVV